MSSLASCGGRGGGGSGGMLLMKYPGSGSGGWGGRWGVEVVLVVVGRF